MYQGKWNSECLVLEPQGGGCSLRRGDSMPAEMIEPDALALAGRSC